MQPAVSKGHFPTPIPKPWLIEAESNIGGTSDRPAWARDPVLAGRLLLLDRNECRDPTLTASIQRVVRDLVPSVITDYSDPRSVYLALGKELGIGRGQIMLAAGSEAGIRELFDVFVEPNDGVICPMPTYIMIPVYCRQFGARLIPVDYVATRNGPMLNCTLLCQRIREERPRLVYLANPNSPTGTVFTVDELRRVIDEAGRNGAVMLLDEAYYPFYPSSAIPLLSEFPHLVVSRTFSKAWGMAGLRLAFLAGQRQIMSYLIKVRPLNEVSTLALAVLEQMLNRKREIEESVARLLDGKTIFCNAMRELGFEVQTGSGNFCLVNFGPFTDRVIASLEHVALFRPMNHPSLSGFQRVTTTTRECFEPIIERITAATR
jgi:histidinol-phosphate aminotransferase